MTGCHYRGPSGNLARRSLRTTADHGGQGTSALRSRLASSFAAGMSGNRERLHGWHAGAQDCLASAGRSGSHLPHHGRHRADREPQWVKLAEERRARARRVSPGELDVEAPRDDLGHLRAQVERAPVRRDGRPARQRLVLGLRAGRPVPHPEPFVERATPCRLRELRLQSCPPRPPIPYRARARPTRCVSSSRTAPTPELP